MDKCCGYAVGFTGGFLTDASYCNAPVSPGRRFCERCQKDRETELETEVRTSRIMYDRRMNDLEQLRAEGKIAMPVNRAELIGSLANDYIRANPDKTMSEVTFGELSVWLLEQATIEEKRSRVLVVDGESALTQLLRDK